MQSNVCSILYIRPTTSQNLGTILFFSFVTSFEKESMHGLILDTQIQCWEIFKDNCLQLLNLN